MDPEAERRPDGYRTSSMFRDSLTIGTQKSTAENDNLRSDKQSAFLRIVRHVVRVVVFIVVLGCLVLAKLSFVAMSQRFNDTRPNPADESDTRWKGMRAANFWRILIALIIPSVLSFLRCVWCGLISRTRKNYPWPSKSAIVVGFFTSIGESIALCVFAFILAAQITNSALTIILMCGVFSATIVDQLRRSHHIRLGRNEGNIQTANEYQQYRVPRNYRRRRHSVVDDKDGHASGEENGEQSQRTHVEPSLWKKVLQKWRMFVKNKRYRTIATWIALILQIGSVTALVVVLLIFERHFSNSHWGILVAIPIALVFLSIVWCSSVQEYLNTPQSIPAADDRPMASARWKNGILTGLWRLVALPSVAIVMASIGYLELDVDLSYLGEGLKQLNDLSEDAFFLVNIFSTWGAYVSAWFACTIMMDTAGFVIPLLLATPVAVFATIGLCARDSQFINGALACGNDAKDPFDAYGIIPVCLTLLWVSQIICCLFYVSRTRLIPLIKEEKLFIQSYYNSPFTEQSLMLNRRIEFDDERLVDPRAVARDSRVFVCTTMYHEELHEQRQLLESIHGIDCEQAKLPTRKFESHVFFDGGAKGSHTTEFANQLFSLLHETLKIDLSDGQKWETPYGMQFGWELPGGMPFNVHLKDPNKVKKKKRWSQVMYMSYILDYRCPKTEYDDDNTFILTTDADIVFSREAVEIVIDLLCRDQQVGAVCGRVHPLGSGPVVWYQIFDYAIGHWFQKVAEHVLGSVMCCPGCFSVFRARALRDVLPKYATKVDKAKDFLTKDMGEDRWLCTLMVQAGWRLEYAAAADSYTYCPDSFDEFYKQRRRWMPSTMANLTELCTNAGEVIANNDAVSILFILYQAAMVFSTIIAPGTVILVMAAGISYAFNTSKDYDSQGTYIAFLVILIIVSAGYGAVCIWCRQETQLKSAKVLTFIFAIFMAAVAVGVVVQIVDGFDEDEKPTPFSNSSLLSSEDGGMLLSKVAVSTWYLAGLAAIFILAALLHPGEFFCLFHALWYLLCLPSGYLFLIIYSICNLNDRSWGTRETVKQNTDGESAWHFLRTFFDRLRDACGCCDCCYRPSPPAPSGTASESPTSKDAATSTDGEDAQANDTGSQQNSTPAASLHPLAEEPHASAAGRFRVSYPPGVLPIREFLEQVGLKEERYETDFKAKGYDDTSFFIKMKAKDIEDVGVKGTGHVKRLMKAIEELPDTSVPRCVPTNVVEWLDSLGLAQYLGRFVTAGYEGKSDVASLVSVDSNVLRHEIRVTKPGHLKKLELAIKMIKYPSDREIAMLRAKAITDDLRLRSLAEEEDEERQLENEFWTELKGQGLAPEFEAYDEVDTLKKKLEELRNETVLVFVVTNIIWIVLITLLGYHADLNVLHTNALGFGFLVIYGLIICIQFLTLIWHRLITIIHYLAHRVRNGSHIIPLGFEMTQYDVDSLDDCEEARIYFPQDVHSGEEDNLLTTDQQQSKRLRQSFQRMLSTSNCPRAGSLSAVSETELLLSASSRRSTCTTSNGLPHSKQHQGYEALQ